MLICRIILAVILIMTASNGYAQTLFNRPDTKPDYSSYRYFDQCLEAVNRIVDYHDIKSPIWLDTAVYNSQTTVTPVHKEAIDAGLRCLSGINLESVSVRDYYLLTRLLLLVNRDEDAKRLVNNTLDNTEESKFKDSLFFSFQQEYLRARPKRILLMDNLLMRDDSPYSKTIDKGGDVLRAIYLAEMALDLGQNDYAANIANEISKQDGRYHARIPLIPAWDLRNSVFPFLLEVSEFLYDDASQSLSSNTADYVEHIKGIWNKLTKEEMPEVGGDRNDLKYIGHLMPSVKGDFSYTNLTDDGLSSESASLNKIRRLPSQTAPFIGKVNLIAFLNGGCHADSRGIPRGRNFWGMQKDDCWKLASMIKRLKKKFPDIRVTVVSKTFGSIGNAVPLKPAEEADTLAEYFLNFHHIPGVHLVTTTEFIRIPGYDQRRVDLPSKFELDWNNWREKNGWGSGNTFMIARSGNFFLVDEKGLIFHTATNLPDRLEPVLIKKISAVIGRQVSASDSRSKIDK